MRRRRVRVRRQGGEEGGAGKSAGSAGTRREGRRAAEAPRSRCRSTVAVREGFRANGPGVRLNFTTLCSYTNQVDVGGRNQSHTPLSFRRPAAAHLPSPSGPDIIDLSREDVVKQDNQCKALKPSGAATLIRSVCRLAAKWWWSLLTAAAAATWSRLFKKKEGKRETREEEEVVSTRGTAHIYKSDGSEYLKQVERIINPAGFDGSPEIGRFRRSRAEDDRGGHPSKERVETLSQTSTTLQKAICQTNTVWACTNSLAWNPPRSTMGYAELLLFYLLSSHSWNFRVSQSFCPLSACRCLRSAFCRNVDVAKLGKREEAII